MNDNDRFATLVARLRSDSQSRRDFEGWDGVYMVDFGSDGRIRFGVRDGKIEALPVDGDFGCRISCSREDAMGILDGSVNMLTAFMQGRLEFAGDIRLAQRLHSFIRAQNYALAEAA